MREILWLREALYVSGTLTHSIQPLLSTNILTQHVTKYLLLVRPAFPYP